MTQHIDTTAEAAKTPSGARRPWTAPKVISSSIERDTAAKTSSGFGFETHSPGSLNGS